MILKDLVLHLDKIFHKNLALTWDRVGLQVGRSEAEIKKIFITLDIDDEVIEEAVNTDSDLIISHHPLIFKPLENVTDSIKGAGGKVLKLIENSIAVYAAHTNYDIMSGGLIDILAEKLELEDVQYIKLEDSQWYKFVIFTPRDSQDKVRKAICSCGGGEFKNYSCCTFNTAGKGTFLPGEGSKPYIGEVGSPSIVDEIRIECIVSENNLEAMIKAAVEAHPYEEVAYDIYKIENNFGGTGLGRYGKLKDPEVFKRYLNKLKQELQVEAIGWLHK
ncbi:MAG: Nif3-like dinuclear metal center hexameric protein, partial [Actinobacteria bacterium]|nr:Nif3-like dinuclear metal center hexameric protein [Actinomycetota bacterium]